MTEVLDKRTDVIYNEHTPKFIYDLVCASERLIIDSIEDTVSRSRTFSFLSLIPGVSKYLKEEKLADEIRKGIPYARDYIRDNIGNYDSVLKSVHETANNHADPNLIANPKLIYEVIMACRELIVDAIIHSLVKTEHTDEMSGKIIIKPIVNMLIPDAIKAAQHKIKEPEYKEDAGMIQLIIDDYWKKVKGNSADSSPLA